MNISSTLMTRTMEKEHWLNSEAQKNIYLVHAGEDVKFLQYLSAELEKEFNQEVRCQYKEFYNQEKNIAKKIEKDVKFCHENQNKCMIIVSEIFIDVLFKSPNQAENINNFISESCKAGGSPKGQTFVLLEMKENTIFNDATFLPIKVDYENDLKKVATIAVNIWQKGDSAQSNEGVNKLAVVAGVVGVSAMAGVAAVAFVPMALGFGAGGIAAGSIGASMMSSAAIANGGGVAAGSLVAILQSAGATGLTMGSAAAGAGVGGAVGAVGTGLAAGASKLKNLLK